MRLLVRDVSIQFQRRRVLSHLSLDVSSPALIGLMGPSGSGKSTLLGIISGDIKADSGFATFERFGAAPNIAWILQSTPMLSRRRAIENVALGPLSVGHTRFDAASIALAAMKLLGVDYTARQRVFELSGGERQRLAVARAIAMDANLILADEPTASLDPAARAAVCDALSLAADSGAIVLVATHDPYVSEQCDVVYWLRDGQLQTT